MSKIDFSKGLFGGGELVERKAVDLDVFVPEIDVSKALALFDRHTGKIEAMYEAAVGLKVTDDVGEAECTKMGSTLQGGIKEMRALGNRIKKPFADVVSTINTTTKMHIERMEAAKALLISKLDMYRAAKELKAKKEAERLRKEAEAAQAQLDKQAEELGVEAPQVNIPTVAPPKASATRTAKGSSFQKKETIVEITDESLLPREYLIPDMVKIRKAAKGGVDIPGVSVKEVKKSQFRTAKS